MFLILYLISALISFITSIDIGFFGAIANDTSYEAGMKNGKAFHDALAYANSSETDRNVVIGYLKHYTLLPNGLLTGYYNISIQLDGCFDAWKGDQDKWPRDQSGSALDLLAIYNSNNITLKGNGTINGNGFLWWWTVFLTSYDNRPDLLSFQSSQNLIIDGITLTNSPKYHLALWDVLDVTVQNVNIKVNVTDKDSTIPTFPLNTDGIDIRGRNAIFRNLTIENFDDAVAIKPTHSGESIFTNCTENILVENSRVTFGVGMSIGSVPPNPNNACIRNITFRNITFDNPIKAIYIKPNPGDKGTGLIANITYENIIINDALWWAIYIGTQQQKQPHEDGTGCSFFYPLPGSRCDANPRVTVTGVVLRDVTIHGGILSPGIIKCNETNPCTDFVFENVNVYNPSKFPINDGFLCENAYIDVKNSNLKPICKSLK